MVIYQIRNLLNNKIYIGSTVDENRRKSDHFCNLNNNKHCNKHLQNSWNKYGESNFSFEVLEEIECDENLLEREQHWLDKTKSYKSENGYNAVELAGNTLGYRHTENSLEKMKTAAAIRKENAESDNKFKMTIKMVNELKYDFSTGKYSYQEIMAKYKISRSNARQIIRGSIWKHEEVTELPLVDQKNIALKQQRKGIFGPKLNFKKAEEMRALYKTGKYTFKQLGMEYGVSAQAAFNISKNITWNSPTFGLTSNNKIKLNLQKAQEIRELYRAGGFSYKKLAMRYGVSAQAIFYIIKNKTWVPKTQKRGV